jgi:predicted branched-subunit amino acid permease
MGESGSFGKGLKWALPVMLGYVSIGSAYGLLALRTGLSVWETVGLSVFVFAGAAQFMAVSMFSSGASAAVMTGVACARQWFRGWYARPCSGCCDAVKTAKTK